MNPSRREMLAIGVGGALAAMAGQGRGEGPGTSEFEQTNEKIVNDFCASWATLDADTISGFVSDKIIYQIVDGMPLVKGKEAFVKFIKPFLSKLERAQWDIKRSHVIGPLVLNERVDNFYSKNKKSDAHFEVAGLFLVRDGKIVEWKDYRMPKKS